MTYSFKDENFSVYSSANFFSAIFERLSNKFLTTTFHS